jgi:hypothetical protein
MLSLEILKQNKLTLHKKRPSCEAWAVFFNFTEMVILQSEKTLHHAQTTTLQISIEKNVVKIFLDAFITKKQIQQLAS